MPAKRSTTVRDRARARLKRSGAACHICGQPIDYSLPHTDPMSFVADHVVPLARGGDDHGEKRAAHRECNSKKRARLVAPIVRRSSSLG